MKKLTIFIIICFIFSTSIFAQTKNNEKPFVIPELKHWEGNSGVFQITSKTKIIFPKDNQEFAEIAHLFSCDFEKMFGIKLKTSDGKSSEGDIVFNINKNNNLKYEEYEIFINDKIEIKANSRRAAIWATRTILQIAEQNERSLPKGFIRDNPDYEMRSFMLDCGRKFIPMDFLHEYVDFMAYYKMNTFHLHLNDNAFHKYFSYDWSKTPSGFRLESDFFPGTNCLTAL